MTTMTLVAIRRRRTGIRRSSAIFAPMGRIRGILGIRCRAADRNGCIKSPSSSSRSSPTAVAEHSAAVGVVEKVISALFLVPVVHAGHGIRRLGAEHRCRQWMEPSGEDHCDTPPRSPSSYGIVVSIVVELTAGSIVGLVHPPMRQ